MEKKTLHMARWGTLTRSKILERLGFRDLDKFNLALLAKQVWRILLNTDSLCTRLLKAIHFPYSSFLDAKLGYRPSWGWSCLLQVRDKIKEGFRFNIGNGKDVCIWDDP